MVRRLLLLASIVSGCGPTTHPMVVRLPPEEQAQVDDAWVNMLSLPTRLDRVLLLDVLLTHQMHQLGVDGLEMTSYKETDNGLVIMEIRYNRFEPSSDRFEFIYEDDTGTELRREVYSGADVEDRFSFLFDVGPRWASATSSDVGPQTEELAREEIEARVRQRQADRAARMEVIRAATQPAEGID